MPTPVLEAMTEPRRAILLAIKSNGPLPIAELAERVGISYEAIRQHLSQLELDGWLRRRIEREPSGPGRPRSLYALTAAGEHLFPKAYDDLAVALIDVANDKLGAGAVRTLLAAVAEKKVEQWLPRVEGKPLAERLEAVRDVYAKNDPFASVEIDNDGGARLVEMNCPYYEVARHRPALCSVTVSVLRRLLGRQVTRVERFQNGDGRCVFQVAAEAADESAPVFDWEPESAAATKP